MKALTFDQWNYLQMEVSNLRHAVKLSLAAVDDCIDRRQRDEGERAMFALLQADERADRVNAFMDTL